MNHYLSQWRYWVILAVVVIIIIWIFTNNKDKRSVYNTSTSTRYIPEPVITHEEEIIPEYDHTRDISVSSRDAVPIVPVNVPVRDVDLTPNIPIDAVAEDTHPKSESKGERRCREVLERIYGVPFVRDRPDWLLNPLTGKRMELDGWNAKLKIAFEYNGEQHYKSNHHFNKSYDMFLQQVARDNAKVDICDRMGVYLITVPYNVHIDKIYNYILHYLPESVAARNNRINQLTLAGQA